MRRLVVGAGLVILAGCGGAVPHSAPARPHPADSTITAIVASTTPSNTAPMLPFSVMFATSPCFNDVWTSLIADKWSLRDAVTGHTLNGGTAYQGRCGFSVQFRLPASLYTQVSEVYVYDPHHQMAGLNQSNAGDPHVRVSGDAGPYQLAANGVIRSGPSLTNCSVLPCR